MMLLGKSFQFLGCYKKAMKWFAKANDIAPKNVSVLRELSSSAARAKMFYEGVRYTKEVIEFFPDDVGLQVNIGLLYIFCKNYPSAKTHLKRAMLMHNDKQKIRAFLTAVDFIEAKKVPFPSSEKELIRIVNEVVV
jgi:tetratricopeptide (TPR) repeat protein